MKSSTMSIQCQSLAYAAKLKMDHDSGQLEHHSLQHSTCHSFSMHSPHPHNLFNPRTHTHIHTNTTDRTVVVARRPPGCAFMNKFHFRVYHIPCAPAADIINLFIFHFLFHFHCCCCCRCRCRGADATTMVDPWPVPGTEFG